MTAPRRMLACLFLLLLVISSGCATRSISVIPSARQDELRQTPEGVVALFESAWNERDLTALGNLFTADFSLGGKVAGPEGADAFHVSCRARAMRRPCDSMPGMGDGAGPAPVRMTLGPRMHGLADSPRLIDTPWHRYVYCMLRVDEGMVPAEADGWTRTLQKVATFVLVRGDSAVVPLGFVAARAAPDSTRWWLQSLIVEPAPGSPGSKEHPYHGFVCGNAIGDFWWP